MSLTIKDPEARRLTQAIAEATGESMTRAVVEALRERYERVQKRPAKAPVEELLAIAKRISDQAKGPPIDRGELLDDGSGLPK